MTQSQHNEGMTNRIKDEIKDIKQRISDLNNHLADEMIDKVNGVITRDELGERISNHYKPVFAELDQLERDLVRELEQLEVAPREPDHPNQ